MNSLIAILCIMINSSFIKDTEYRLAVFIIEHFYDIHLYSLNEIAENCYTSTATVKKFFRKLGDTDYTMFKFHIANSIAVRSSQMDARYQPEKYRQTMDLISHFYPSLNTEKLTETIRQINTAIHESRRVMILGAAYPNALAVNYQDDMIFMHKPVLIEPSVSSMLYDFQEIRDDDFVIITTITGSFFNIYPMRKNEVEKFHHLAIITRETTDLSSFPEAIPVYLPEGSDDEMYNYFLLSFYQLLKTDYYNRYALSTE